MPELSVLECMNCGLVSLDDKSHISYTFYENSGMHGGNEYPISSWLNDTIEDDERRFSDLKAKIINASILDFGCGAGGFLRLANEVAGRAVGIELESRIIQYWSEKLEIFSTLEALEEKFDIITAFHVFEHLPDPVATLNSLKGFLKPNGVLVIEVPNSNDILLTTYASKAFQNFTYWSQHLQLFNASNLRQLAELVDMHCLSTKHIQRYPLSNHLYWLSQEQPGGHKVWNFLDSEALKQSYEAALAKVGKTDTILALLTHA